LQALLDAPAPVYQLPQALPGHTRHYIPTASYSPAKPGETAKVIDSYLALDPDAPLRVWWDVDLDAEAAGALTAVASAVGYLGRSESICAMRFSIEPVPHEADLARPLAADEGGAGPLTQLLCPEPGQTLESIAVSVTQLRKQRRVMPPGAQRVAYALPSMPEPVPERRHSGLDRPTLGVLRLRGGSRPSITEAVAVGQALRAALQARYGDSNGKAASSTFSGRAGNLPRADQHRHAHFLSAPGKEGRRIDRLYVWAPEGFGEGEVAALAGLTYIRLHELPSLQCALVGLGTAEELKLPDLVGPATAWRSLTPFGLVRHPKRRRGTLLDGPEDQVRCELEHRGLPGPAEVELQKGSWHRFRSSKAGGSRLERASLFGVKLRFDHPVPGPLTLGALSHYGLGLMVPDN